MPLRTIEIETGDYPRATVMLMHGLGADGNDFVPLVQELVLEGSPAAQAAYRGKESVTIEGSLEYQACDDRVCFNPVSVPLSWTLGLKALVTERAPRPPQ